MKRIICILCVLFLSCVAVSDAASAMTKTDSNTANVCCPAAVFCGVDRTTPCDSVNSCRRRYCTRYAAAAGNSCWIANHGIYVFISLESVTNPKSTAKALTVWSSFAGNAANVNLYEVDHSDAQRWKAVRCSEAGNAWFLRSMLNTDYALDRFSGYSCDNAVTIYTAATNAAGRTDQLVTFIPCGTYNGSPVVYITMVSDGMRLSAADSTNTAGKNSGFTGNACFGSGTGSRQKWIAIPVSNNVPIPDTISPCCPQRGS